MPALDPTTQNLLRSLLLLAGVLILVAVGIQVVQIYRRRALRGDRQRGEPITPFREAYEAGLMADEEFRRIEAALGPATEPSRRGRPVSDAGRGLRHRPTAPGRPGDGADPAPGPPSGEGDREGEDPGPTAAQ